ncbi:hypothetical protein [Tenacibaculum ovolyticum]|uniref:hypothetical protein n=1 Tax=Tenacibaculum ovolyticum TaxID=104270 RepID=UPI0007ED334E|nr:hypothetical protein [Tenacibaculum ovolyticum]
MKNRVPLNKCTYAGLVFILLICISCNSKNEKLKPMEGVWELSEFYHLANGDTLRVDTTKVQHKFYLNGRVIWNTDPEKDGSEWHGYGTYTFKNDTITEILTSMSKTMKSTVNKYIIPIERGNKWYKQVNTYMRNDTIYKNIEVYKKLD